jgi:hypothetical protein
MSTDREQWIREQAEAEFPYYPQDQFDLTDPDDHRTYTRMKSDMNYKREGFIAGAKWLQSQCPSAPQGDNWISVEKPPKNDDEVLVGLWRKIDGWFICDEKDQPHSCIGFYEDGKWKFGYGSQTYEFPQDEVVGWMPMPLPLPPSRSVKGGNNQNESI